MAATQVEFRVERFIVERDERERGYLPVRRKREYQRLVKITPGWFGSRREVIDVEEIPADVLICLGAFGDTGGWRSKFATYIGASRADFHQRKTGSPG